MTRKQGEFLGHPKGLFVLFFTEMWERFSYYGMRALLMLYMVNYFKFTQEHASSIYKWYTSLVYLTPLIGGYLADRYLGNKRAIIIGSTLMAIGHFCMAFEQHTVFYAALVFLIIGNGFFKPNMSTQVGRLYAANDPRRDGAYTIFYMGINLGAFLSPLICGWLRMNTKWEYHAGFTAAGIGMVLGLITYLVFIKWVEEIPGETQYEGDDAKGEVQPSGQYMTEEAAKTTPSVLPAISGAAPVLLNVLGVLLIPASVLLWWFNIARIDNAVALGLGGGFACFMSAWLLSKQSMAVRDRVLAIYFVGVFVVFFWAAFEQAGNAMNVFADKTTERYLTQPAPEPDLFPITGQQAAGSAEHGFGIWWSSLWNPVSTEWFQSINALAIFVLAPLFAWLWTYLPRRGIKLSIPAKMAIGIFLQAMAFALMIWAIKYEDQPSSANLEALPRNVQTDEEGRVVFRDAPDLADDEAFKELEEPIGPDEDLAVVQGGRIFFDNAANELNMSGVLSDTDRDRILRATAPPDYIRAVKELADKSKKAAAGSEEFSVTVTLPSVPKGFDIRYAGFPSAQLSLDPSSQTLTTSVVLLDKDYKGVLVCGAEPVFRDALNELYVKSAMFKVSAWWLVWFYILCTLGELCLSPVGLSMVSKLAPIKYATMLMGIWHLTFFFGNFVAGFAGESYGTLHPAEYFGYIALVVGAASLLCFFAVKKIKSMMHGVI